MKNVMSLARGVLFLILVLPVTQSHAFDREKIDLMVEVMTVACSIGMKVAINVNADGKVSIFKKGVEGQFEASKSEIPTVVDLLSDENLKGDQADKTRACMDKYVSAIFYEITGDNSKGKPTEDVSPVTEDGVVYKFNGCYKQGRNKIQCELTVVSSLIDRTASYYLESYNGRPYSALFDNFGNQYFASVLSVANHANTTEYGLYNAPLIADTPMTMLVRFDNIGSNAKSISLLSIGADSGKKYNVRFRDLEIKEKAS